MDNLSKNENILLNATQQLISLSSSGISPTDALEKVARNAQLNPEMVMRTAQAFNKAYAYHIMKEASPSTRADSFDLADSKEVLRRLYGTSTMEKSAANTTCSPTEFSLPHEDFTASLLGGGMQKAAGYAVAPQARVGVPGWDSYAMQFSTVGSRIESTCERIREKTANARLELDKAMDAVADEMVSMTDTHMRKVAQNVVNAYGSVGTKFLAYIGNRIRREFPPMNKTANAVVFPGASPYFSIGRAIDAARNLVHMNNKEQAFLKQAGPLTSIAKQVAAKSATGMLEEQAKSQDGGRDFAIDPELVQKLQMLEAKSNFFQLVSGTEDFQPYNMDELIDAYNASVLGVPEAAGNILMLKSLMLRNLESGGVKDTFELGQEADISKKVQSTQAARAKDLQAEMDEAKAPEREPFKLESSGKDGKSKSSDKGKGFGASLRAGAGKAGDLAIAVAKDSKARLAAAEEAEKKRQAAAGVMNFKYKKPSTPSINPVPSKTPAGHNSLLNII